MIKSRVQLSSTPPVRGAFFSGGYVGNEARAILREGGVGALFRGLGPSLLRAVPAAASTFVAFEMTRGEFRCWV